MKSVFAIIFCGVFCGAFSGDLPSYITPCSLKDPAVNECIRKEANAVIPTVIKGEPLLGLPVLSPLVIPKLDIGGANLQIKLTDLRNDDLKKLRFSKALFDFANTKGGFVGFIDKVTVLATYSIKNGRIGSRSVSGSGKFNMTLIKKTMDYKCDVAVTEKDGEQHLYIPKSTLDLTVERAYYYFENLRLSSGGNANAYVDKNWSLVRAELKPSLDKFFKNFLTTTLTNLGATIPMRKLFKV